MATEKILLIWYSRTGTTRAVGEAVARALGCDAEELIDRRDRGGVFGTLRASVDALFGRTTTLGPLRHDPAEYSLVIVGTPVWFGSVTPAVRTFLRANAPRIPRLAFFCTSRSGATQRVFEQMAAVSGRAPVEILAVTERDARGRALVPRVGEFVAALTEARAAA